MDYFEIYKFGFDERIVELDAMSEPINKLHYLINRLDLGQENGSGALQKGMIIDLDDIQMVKIANPGNPNLSNMRYHFNSFCDD